VSYCIAGKFGRTNLLILSIWQKKVGDLVSSEFGISKVQVNHAIRLGAPNQTKPRLLLVQLANISTKRAILRQAVKLRKSAKWRPRDVYILPDLTPKEREHNKRLREELKSRKKLWGAKSLY